MTIETMPIETLELSVRCQNALHREGIHTVKAFLELSEEKLYAIRNLGQKSVQEILSKQEELRMMPKTDADLKEENEKQKVYENLQKAMLPLEVLEILPARALNLLYLAGYEYVHQIAQFSIADLMQIPRMDSATASEIIMSVEAYLSTCAEKLQEEVAQQARDEERVAQVLLELVLADDVELKDTALSNRSRNQLENAGYYRMSEIINLTEAQLQQIRGLGAKSVQEISEFVEMKLAQHEKRARAYCAGDENALFDDERISEAIFRLYQSHPFGGYSLREMQEKLEERLVANVERLKRVVGGLLAAGELEYVDFRCFRVYDRFETFLQTCDNLDERERDMLLSRLKGVTLDELGQKYNLTRERPRQIINKAVQKVQSKKLLQTGNEWFDEDYYAHFYQTYQFDRRDIAPWLGVSEAVWRYFDMMNIKQGTGDLAAALEDSSGLSVSLRLKIKNYLNRNKVYIDGIWVEQKRSALEPIVVRKTASNSITFSEFVEAFNRFLEELEIPYDESIYYTDAVFHARKNRLAESRFILWKYGEQLRYYDIDSRDYTQLLEILNLDAYENVEYSTAKFFREHPEIMGKYDIRDQYELHNLLRKIVPDGAYHDFHCKRTPMICFGEFDRDRVLHELLVAVAPISTQDLVDRIEEIFGYDRDFIIWNLLKPLHVYYHQGIYSIEQKVMSDENQECLRQALTEDFYFFDEIRRIYMQILPHADVDEINPFNLKTMGYTVLSQYMLQNYDSLDSYLRDLFTRSEVVDITRYRRRFARVQMYYQVLMDMKRELDVVEFEPNQLLNFRKLESAGVTKNDLRRFCDEVYQFIPEGAYFSARSLRQDGFVSELYDLGFSDWFYANLLLADGRFAWSNMYGTFVLCKCSEPITIKSFLLQRIEEYGCVSAYDLINELTERFGCRINDRSDVTYKLHETPVFHDRILDRLYATEELYYRELDEKGGF